MPDVDVIGVRLDAPADVSAALWQLLSGEEQQRAERFRYVEHRQRYIVARGSLRRLLAERLDIAPRAVELVETSYGKPKLAVVHSSADLGFNLSHSGVLALYAFTKGRAVGIDVELVRQVPDAEDLAERFFSASEYAALRSLPLDGRSLAFLACWTRKEAFIKALGLGLSCPLDAFDVTIDPDGPARFTRIEARTGRIAHWKLQAFTPYPSYIAALAYHADSAATLDRNEGFSENPSLLNRSGAQSVLQSVSWRA
jgi:4'-phosphopantetheinyl transferase